MSDIKPFSYSYSIQGVQVKPLSEDGKKVSILYNGLLARSGAGQVYLHCGFGKKDTWQQVNDLPMERRNGGWEKTLTVGAGNRLNFCFKDSIDNWDNNQGSNWAYHIAKNS